ncbi:unnamed protein product, partial [Ectocarpus sp. 12 AP-2014]
SEPSPTAKTADSEVCRYADWLISTVNTRSPEERAAHPGGVPDPHPYSVNPFKHGPVSDDATGRADIDGLINCCQRHVCRPEGNCKRAGRQGCRFGFPCTSVSPRPPCISRRWTTAP